VCSEYFSTKCEKIYLYSAYNNNNNNNNNNILRKNSLDLRAVLYNNFMVYCLVLITVFVYISVSQLRIMDFRQYVYVSFGANPNTGHSCEELNNMLGESIWNDTFKTQ